jgi:hypothetical protein
MSAEETTYYFVPGGWDMNQYYYQFKVPAELKVGDTLKIPIKRKHRNTLIVGLSKSVIVVRDPSNYVTTLLRYNPNEPSRTIYPPPSRIYSFPRCPCDTCRKEHSKQKDVA